MNKQKDFEKGWEEYKAKKKQEIEEMANDIKSSLGLHLGKTILYPYIAQDLYACGYRKIPENAVVLNREEYERLGLVEETVQEYESVNGQPVLVKERKEVKKIPTDIAEFIRKKTAEKFAEKVKEIKIRLDLIGNPYEKKYTQADLKEVANGVLNQFLRYIDEIAKEIIGEEK